MCSAGVCAGNFRKGRYFPLRALVQRVGALWLLELEPLLVTSTLQAMEREPICNTASSFLEALLRRLQRDLLAAGMLLLPPCQSIKFDIDKDSDNNNKKTYNTNENNNNNV